MEIKDRLDSFRNSRNITVQAFEIMLGASNGSWSKTKSVSEENLLAFIKIFPEISLQWLIKGEGEMYDSSFRGSSNNANDELIELCKTLVANYQQRDQVVQQLITLLHKLE